MTRYNKFIRKTLVRDNYTCQCCGKTSKETNLEVHHLDAFKKYEDNFLLNLIEMRIPGTTDYMKPDIDIDRAVFDLGTLYGDAGGTYKEIEIKIGPIPENMKSELKSLVFYLDY